MRILALLFCSFLLAGALAAQSIPRNDPPRYMVGGYDADENDGQLILTFGVSMADCISDIEIDNLTKGRTTHYKPNLDHYFVRDNDMEEIYAKIPVGRFRRMVDKKTGLQSRVTIWSKSGRVVFKGKVDMILENEEDVDPTDKATARK